MTATADQPHLRRTRRVLPLLLAVVGVAVVVFALLTQQSPPTAAPSAAGTITPRSTTPRPAATSARPSPTPTPTSASPTPTPTTKLIAKATKKASQAPTKSPKKKAVAKNTEAVAAPLPPSEPVSISIPAIDVDSPVFSIGLDSKGALEAPQPGPNLNHVAWFEKSPTPGQLGPSVLEGHVDTDQGRSVFYRLGDVTPGDNVEIERQDGRTAVYQVDAVRSYSKAKFPTNLVYGGDLSRPSLRLITCSDFDRKIGHYAGNLVVFGHLTSVR